MELSCECGDPSDWDWYYETPSEEEEFTPLRTETSQPCSSCKKVIRVGETCMTFRRFSTNEYDEDENPLELEPIHMCETCAEQWLNLEGVGYCVPVDEDIMISMRQYWDLTGYTPEEYRDEKQG